MSSSSQTNYIFLYSGEVFSSISGESDALYIKGAGAAANHIAFYGPTGTFANKTSFGYEVRITQSEENSFTTASLGDFRLRNMTTGTTAPSTSTGGAGTSGGYGSLFLVYT
jgi:hypothetical protein